MLSQLVNVQYCYNYTIDNQISIGLLLYAHLPAAIISLLFGLFLLYRTRTIQGVTLFIICFSFSIWTFLNLASWFSFLGSASTMFTWSLIDLFGLIMFLFSYYFLYVFIKNKDLPVIQKVIGILLLLPTAVWTLLGLNLPIYDANYCEAVENTSITGYLFYIQAVLIFITLVFSIAQYRKAKDKEVKKKIMFAGTGIFIFLFFFLSSTWVASFMSNYESLAKYAYNYEIYGLFGMPILLVFLGFLIVRYRAFNIKMIGTQALILGLVALISSQFAFIQTDVNRVLTGITLIFTGVIGINLMRSVKREVEQRERIEGLAKQLEDRNEQLNIANEHLKELDQKKTEFVSIASHQLRAPLTAIKGYSSMILEGSFGTIEARAKEAVERIFESSQRLVVVIEDFLNVTRIELGKMKYEVTDFDLNKLAKTISTDLKDTAARRNLKLTYKAPKEPIMVKADYGKIGQAVQNLIDNAIKYTEPGGKISATLTREASGKARFAVKDTGIGISKEGMDKLFEKFSRAEDGKTVNAIGTGLGLYVARQIVEAQGGKIWAESEGLGKGSTFFLEI